MRFEMWAALLGLAVILPALPAGAVATERVLAFHSDVRVAPDGTLAVTETIEIQGEGKPVPGGGLLREFPARYRDRAGNSVALPLEVLKVTRNGRTEPYSIERSSGGTRIRVRDGDVLPRGKHLYAIAYRTGRQVTFYDRYDEVYWNVTGGAWRATFDRLSAEVSFAEPVPAGSLVAEALTGADGTRGQDYNAFVRQGSAAFRATRPLKPGEAMVVVVAFPKGVVAPPPLSARASATARLVIVLLLFLSLAAAWRRWGGTSVSGLKP
jgi:hypothetical protein